MKATRIFFLLVLLAACTAGTKAQTWYLTGYDQSGNVKKNGNVEAIVNIAEDLDCLLSSLGNSASYFAIMRKHNEGVWFNNVYKATFSLEGDTPTRVDAATVSRPRIDVADSYVVISDCQMGSEVALLTTDGRVAYRRKASDTTLLIDTSSLPKGIYLVRTATGTLKFIRP